MALYTKPGDPPGSKSKKLEIWDNARYLLGNEPKWRMGSSLADRNYSTMADVALSLQSRYPEQYANPIIAPTSDGYTKLPAGVASNAQGVKSNLPYTVGSGTGTKVNLGAGNKVSTNTTPVAGNPVVTPVHMTKEEIEAEQARNRGLVPEKMVPKYNIPGVVDQNTQLAPITEFMPTPQIDGMPTPPMNDFDFIAALKAGDQEYLDSANRFINQKTVGDIAATGAALYSNLTAPLPDQIAAPHYTSAETNFPLQTLLAQNQKQQGNLISSGVGLARATGMNTSPAVSGGLVDLGSNFSGSLASTLSDFVNNQQVQSNQVGNLNAQALGQANAANIEMINADNLRRSELTTGLVSQLGKTMTERGAAKLGLKNMANSQMVLERYVDQLVKSGQFDKLNALFAEMGVGYGWNPGDIDINASSNAEETYE
jgi:hypothetical protein